MIFEEKKHKEGRFLRESVFAGILVRKQGVRFYSGHFYPRDYSDAEQDEIASDSPLF